MRIERPLLRELSKASRCLSRRGTRSSAFGASTVFVAWLAACTISPVLLGDRARLVELEGDAHLALLTGRYADALPDEEPKLVAALYFVHPPSGLSSIEVDVRKGPHPGLRLVWSPAGGPRAGKPCELRAEVSPRSGGLRLREREYRLEEGRVFVVEAEDGGIVASRQIAAFPGADEDEILGHVHGGLAEAQPD